MPLGDSITWGTGSSDHNGYRKGLRDSLIQDGYKVAMVGQLENGDMSDNKVEGWQGYRVDLILDKAKKSVPSRLPSVFTVNAGTNDCLQDYKASDTSKHIGDLLEYLWNSSPDSTVILSTLIPNFTSGQVEKHVEDVNDQIKALAKRKQAEKKRLVLVDMHAWNGPKKEDMIHDGTHPNDGGYEKMAKIWHRGIQEAALKGFLHEPKDVPGRE